MYRISTARWQNRWLIFAFSSRFTFLLIEMLKEEINLVVRKEVGLKVERNLHYLPFLYTGPFGNPMQGIHTIRVRKLSKETLKENI